MILRGRKNPRVTTEPAFIPGSDVLSIISCWEGCEVALGSPLHQVSVLHWAWKQHLPGCLWNNRVILDALGEDVFGGHRFGLSVGAGKSSVCVEGRNAWRKTDERVSTHQGEPRRVLHRRDLGSLLGSPWVSAV